MPRKLCQLDSCDKPVARAGHAYCSRGCYHQARILVQTAERLCKAGKHYYIGKRCPGCASEGAALRRGRVLPETRAARTASIPRETPPEGELVWRPDAWGGSIVRYPNGSERPAKRKEIDRWQVLHQAS